MDDYADIDGTGTVEGNDLGYFTDEWLWMADPNGLISRLTPDFQKKYLESLLDSTIYGDKAKTEVLKVVKVSPDKTPRNHYEGIIPQLAQNNSSQKDQKPSLKQMLALSNNGHDKDLQYETIDHKLHTNNHRAFMGSQGRKRLYKPAA